MAKLEILCMIPASKYSFIGNSTLPSFWNRRLTVPVITLFSSRLDNIPENRPYTPTQRADHAVLCERRCVGGYHLHPLPCRVVPTGFLAGVYFASCLPPQLWILSWMRGQTVWLQQMPGATPKSPCREAVYRRSRRAGIISVVCPSRTPSLLRNTVLRSISFNSMVSLSDGGCGLFALCEPFVSDHHSFHSPSWLGHSF